MAPKPNERKEWGMIGLLLALLVLLPIAAFLSDTQGTRHSWFGAFSWLLFIGLTFVLLLIYYAQFVSPLRGEDGWIAGFLLLLQAYVKVGEDRLDFSGDDKSKKKKSKARTEVDKLPSSLKSLNAGFIRGYQVLAITKGSSYVRPAGPGFVVLYRGEQIWRVIDLRPQRRSQPVKAKTRDGIPVETSVWVLFQVKRADGGDDDDLLYPFDREAIFQVSYDETVDEQGRHRPWTAQLTPPAAAILTNEIPKFSLDELLHAVDGVAPLEAIKQTITRNLQRRFLPKGIEVLSVGIGGLTLPDGVRDQQFLTWQAEWLRKIQAENATGNAEVVRRMQQARARAQIEIIENITHSIETMRREEDADLSQIIMLRMIEALEGAVSGGSVQALVPQQIIAGLVGDASRQMQSWVSPPKVRRLKVDPPSLSSGENDQLGDGE
ncbi:SPFH domain-containing protein [Candidatus Leptofilum sp.]|uniref:SPFH domain-containing protein n=1 Tax=Candidatus Leptofilum sp. TaxID=3241576 RepID=UPI003B5A4877